MDNRKGVLVAFDETKSKSKVTVEQYILQLYNCSIEYLISQQTFSYIGFKYYRKGDSYDIDVIAKNDIRAELEIGSIGSNYGVMCILDENLLNKYAAYIWKDHFLISGLGMMLNNGDDKHPVNCRLDEDFNVITTRGIKKGESLRIDYGYKDNYPPIPQEILNIRKTLLSPYDKGNN